MSDTNPILNKINNLYRKTGYMGKYGNDVWVSAVICVSFIVFINYYYFANVLQVIKADWPAQRCNPLIAPFAGFIQRPTNMTNLEFTADNFNDCLKGILKNVVLLAVQPLQFALVIIQDAVNSLVTAYNKLRQMTAGLREQFNDMVKRIYGIINNILVAFISYMIKIKDSMLKINGILTTMLYTMFGSYMAISSLFLVMIDFILVILITIAVLIIVYWIIMIILLKVPFVGVALALPFKLQAIITTLIMIAILIPTVWFQIMLLRVMDMSTPPPPGVPGCFAEKTPIDMFERGQRKPIKDIEVGDILKYGSKVTGIIKCAADEQNIYKLRGIYVTGEHRVFHNKLRWIKVKDHPESVYVPTYNEPFVYCLNTDKKSFLIGDTLFSDWDDINEEVIEDLNKYCVNTGYLPKNFTFSYIHRHLDSGFTGDSTVLLNTGVTIQIKDVKVNDVLASSDKILGVVKIAAHDLSVYKYSFTDNKIISGSSNIHVDDKSLGVINCMVLDKNMKKELIESKNELFLYHLLTDSKFVVVNNIRFNDYNSGIDKYLRQFN
jgi:hypothetical protein